MMDEVVEEVMDGRRQARYTACKQRYQKERKIGEGTYAVVYQGVDRHTNRKIAIKKIKMSSTVPGLDISALREIKILKVLQHANIVDLVDVFSSHTNLQIVLAYCPYDLEKLIKEKSVPFSSSDVKAWMLMLLRGVEAMHIKFIVHRDLKPNNLLISEDGLVKIADFGLARPLTVSMGPTNAPFYSITGLMTSQVVTRWYRAPELLFGARQYSGAVDVWAAGCIFAELLLRTPFLPGESDIGQLNCMCRALGTPKESDWPGMKSLPDFFVLPEHPKMPLQSIFPAASNDALDLLSKMLAWDPSKRCTARQALSHPYFINDPQPTIPALLPKSGGGRPEQNIDPKRMFT